MLEILKASVRLSPKLRIYVYSRFDTYGELFENAVRETDGKIIMSEFVSHDEILRVYENSDVFINVGNLVKMQTPSKIFDYMSYSKPIVHFYSDNDDTSIKYFNEYKNVCYIDTNSDTFEMAKKLCDFCNNSIVLEPVSELVTKPLLSRCTPSYATSLLLDELQVNDK